MTTAAATAEAAPAAPAAPATRGLRLPSAYTILIGLIVAVAIATWIIPAGRYDFNADGTPIPGTYHAVEATPARILRDSLTAPINGMYGITGADGTISYYNSGELFGAIDVALFILIIGGFLGVTMQTGAIQSGIARIVQRLHGRERLMIPVLMAIFALGGTTFGMAEESLAFYVLIITVMVAAGYDSVTGAAILLLGCGIGVMGSTINPFATGIASGFAGTSIDAGLIGRLVILVVGTIVGTWWVMRYSARVKADPSRSLVAANRTEIDAHFLAGTAGDTDTGPMTGKQKVVLVLFFLAFLVMIVGIVPWSDLGISFIPTLAWWFPEMTASFLLFSILIGIAGGTSESKFVDGFVNGARDLLGVALIIGIARGVTVIMTNGQITDTVLNAAEQAVSGLGGVAFINLMFALFLPLSFLIPSSSGLATVAMPIMAPLASFANVAPELVVTAYQTGNGIVNLVTPTSAVVMGGLAIARVGYGTWLKFVWPVLIVLAVLCMVVMSAAVLLK
ncbi:MAG: YfcC family protein [Chloroflexota bacterium]